MCLIIHNIRVTNFEFGYYSFYDSKFMALNWQMVQISLPLSNVLRFLYNVLDYNIHTKMEFYYNSFNGPLFFSHVLWNILIFFMIFPRAVNVQL